MIRVRLLGTTLALAGVVFLLAACGNDDPRPDTSPNATTLAGSGAVRAVSSSLEAAFVAEPGVDTPAIPSTSFATSAQVQPLMDELASFGQGAAVASAGSEPFATGSFTFTNATYACGGGGQVTLDGTVSFTDNYDPATETRDFSIATGPGGLQVSLSDCSDDRYRVSGSATEHVNRAVTITHDPLANTDTLTLAFNDSGNGNLTAVRLSPGTSYSIVYSHGSDGMIVIVADGLGNLVSYSYNFTVSLSVNGQSCSGTFTGNQTSRSGSYSCN